MSSEVDVEKLAALFQSRYGLLVGVARRHAPMPDLVYDIVQQVFLEFIGNAPKRNWDLQRDVTPLLCRMTRDCAAKFWQQQRKHSPESVIRLAEELGTLAQESEDVGEEQYDEELSSLAHCMKGLSDPLRILVEEHYIQGISLERIARQNKGNAGTLRKTLFRLRVKLRECVERNLAKRDR